MADMGTFLLAAAALAHAGIMSTAAATGAAASPSAPCPAPGTPLLRGSLTEPTLLNFTGGYEANAHCEFHIQCDAGLAVKLRLTAMDTEADRDFVSLYDGGTSSSPWLAQLSGLDATPDVGATGADLLLVFTSDNVTEADGFAAEYWCAAAGAAGEGRAVPLPGARARCSPPCVRAAARPPAPAFAARSGIRAGEGYSGGRESRLD